MFTFPTYLSPTRQSYKLLDVHLVQGRVDIKLDQNMPSWGAVASSNAFYALRRTEVGTGIGGSSRSSEGNKKQKKNLPRVDSRRE